MSEGRVERRLAAILVADVVGYSRLMGQDEAGTLARLRKLRRDLIDPRVANHKGRLVKTTGDGILIEFPSVVEAVACAAAVQREMVRHNAPVPEDQRMEFRVGINLGDVIVEGDDIHGDGVNVAARLEALAGPGGICISGGVHDQVQGRLDISFEDSGEQRLKNIARPVRIYRALLGEAVTVAAASRAALVLPDKRSIAVLPFQNMSGDPEQDYFADGMVEEIITALSRIRWLSVMARNSSFTYKGRAVDVKQVGHELGVRYVLEGSVRKAGNRVRITAQLVDAETGAHLWAERFDGSLEDVFDLQDQVATSVAGIIEPTLLAAETARSVARPTNDLTAYDLYLRAYAMFLGSTREVSEALSLAEQAIVRDPHYGPALACAAICCRRLLLSGQSENPAEARGKGSDFARRALEVAGDDPVTLANAAFALAYFGENIGAMITYVDRALVLNPSYARGWHLSGILRLMADQPDIAIEHVQASLRLSPRARSGWSHLIIGMAHLYSRRFDQAVPKLLLAIQDDSSAPQPYRALAACYAYMGRPDDAREVVAQLRAITSVVIPSGGATRRSQGLEYLLAGLRLAVAEET